MKKICLRGEKQVVEREVYHIEVWTARTINYNTCIYNSDFNFMYNLILTNVEIIRKMPTLQIIILVLRN